MTACQQEQGRVFAEAIDIRSIAINNLVRSQREYLRQPSDGSAKAREAFLATLDEIERIQESNPVQPPRC